jgi:hypothetical protein
MTQTTTPEPTLKDVFDSIEHLSGNFERLSGDVKRLSGDVEKLDKDVEGFNNRFSDYQQAVQWVVQLAFSLIASATVTVIITSIFHR